MENVLVNLGSVPVGMSLFSVAVTSDPVDTPKEQRSIEEVDVLLKSNASAGTIVTYAMSRPDWPYGDDMRVVGVANESDGYLVVENWGGYPVTPEEQLAQNVWAYGTNDDVWDAMFDLARSEFAPKHVDIDYVELAGELLAKIESDPSWTVGDLTHEQVIAAVHRRYPILGPNPF